MPLDLASFASVRAFARPFARHARPARHPREQRRRHPASSASDRRRARDAVPDEPPGPLPADGPAARDQLGASAPARVVDGRVGRAPVRTRRPDFDDLESDAQVPRVPHVRAHEAHEHPVHARARPPLERHRRDRQRGASRLRRQPVRAGRRHRVHGQRRHAARPPVRALARDRRADVGLPRVVTAARRRHRPVLRQVGAGQARGDGPTTTRSRRACGTSARRWSASRPEASVGRGGTPNRRSPAAPTSSDPAS